eukprot:GFUD01039113.1.p2 GENE.GFUD01039113.1~~GFUD01039113.1.p2  ORF type:complete len:124 (+),score=9.14 GFUD01039113.1:113-484(+)
MLLLFFSLFSFMDASTPSACQLSIVRCCDTELGARALPLRCFEVNGCPGLFWHGQRTCGGKMVAAAISSLNSQTRGRMLVTVDSEQSSAQHSAYYLPNFLAGPRIRPVVGNSRIHRLVSPLFG